MLKVAWSSEFFHPLPKSHRFPMSKYEMLPDQLLYEGTLTKDNFFKPDLITEENILHTHEESYWLKLKNGNLTKAEIRKTGFPFSEKLVVRERHIVNGTLLATKYAMENGIAMNIAGGTHHAFTNRGEGFCLLNDIAIASNYLLKRKIVSKILIVDLDVHQGNGTAEIFQNNPQVFTFSMHGKNNFPLEKENSDLDISLPDGTPDSFYLQLLKETLARLMDEVKPEPGTGQVMLIVWHVESVPHPFVTVRQTVYVPVFW